MVTAKLSSIFRSERDVREDEIDEMQHVNNLVYLRWAMDAAVAHSTAVGWSPERYRQLGSGFIVRSHSIKYKRSATLGDRIATNTWIDTMEKVSSVRKYEIRRANDDKLLALAETNWVFVDLATQALCRIPGELVDDFARDV